ncbi:MAG TPA: ABC transporter permease [Solirubrobacteraceae bacterium]|jgi:putative ABC transport system permease protein
MKLSNIVRLYRVRLRSRVVQELFAVLGIAVGVALLFASQVASTSLNGSIQQLTSGVVGQMRFQLAARDPHGFDERLLGEVQRLPGVLAAIPVLEERVNLIGPTGQRTVDLLGTDPRLARLGGPLIRHFRSARLSGFPALAAPAPVARAIGVASLQSLKMQIGARMRSALLGTTLTEADIGALVHSPIVLGPLRYVQRLTEMTGLITRVFVQPRPGRDGEVKAGLERLAAGAFNVRSGDFDAALFRQAAGPTNQSTVLFSAISALIGFLFSFNAMLLTVPQRRNLVEDLRLDGYTGQMIIRVLLFDAVVLGVFASLVGLLLGELLSVALFSANPGYLTLGFPVGSQRVVSWQSIALAVGGGLLAACVGVLGPLRREIWLPLASAFSRPERSTRGKMGLVVLGLGCLVVTTLIVLLAPQAAIAGIVSLIVAMLLLFPAALMCVIAVWDHLRRLLTGVSSYLAVIELRSSANRARSLAIGATGAIAVFGSVAIQGAHSNLQRGLDRLVHQLSATADVWVIPPGQLNLLATTPFRDADTAALVRLPGVKAVEPFRAALLDFEDRRVWILAPPVGAARPIPVNQLVSGDLASAVAHVRSGGWAVVSQALAHEHRLHIGQAFTLPSPRPTTFRVAALSTNLGWPPGAILLNAADYARAWGTTDLTAYDVTLTPGVSATRVRLAIQKALGPSGLGVETSHVRELRQRAASRQGLERLTQISLLVLIAAVLAMGTAMGAMIWQRRQQLADMKVDGFKRDELWRALLLESALLLGTGCSIGALFGIYGQVLLSHALATVTGFPVIFSLDAMIAVVSFLLVTAVAVSIVAVPGYLATRVRPALSLQD